MSRDDGVYLLDMLPAAREAVAFADGLAFADFERNRMAQFALLKAVETVGETAAPCARSTGALRGANAKSAPSAAEARAPPGRNSCTPRRDCRSLREILPVQVPLEGQDREMKPSVPEPHAALAAAGRRARRDVRGMPAGPSLPHQAAHGEPPLRERIRARIVPPSAKEGGGRTPRNAG